MAVGTLRQFRYDPKAETLLARIANGDLEALSKAYYDLAFKVSGHEQPAEAALHEVFLNFWRHPFPPGRIPFVFRLVTEARHLSFMTQPSK